MNNNDSKRTFLAIFLAIVIVAGWQYFFPPTPHRAVEEKQQISTKSENVVNHSNDNLQRASVGTESLQPTNEISTFRLGEYELVVDRFLTITDIKGPFQKRSSKEIFGQSSALQLGLWRNGDFLKMSFFSAQPLTENNSQILRFTLNDNLGYVDFTLNDKNLIRIIPRFTEGQHLAFLFSQSAVKDERGLIKQFLFNHTTVERFNVGKEDSGEGPTKWFGVDYDYHLFAIVPEEGHSFRYSATEGDSVQFIVRQISDKTPASFDLAFTPKNYDLLKDLGRHLDLSIDFGFFAFLAVPILRGLQFFYSYIPNYGVGIILLTLVIRLLTFPLQYKSFKSMKKMQKLQPEMAKVKEKYQDDPQRMQKETMELFKKHGANPMGGCLPMLLQMPVFLAFYKVLYSAIELVGAPFVGWVHDLSAKDPYFVLPILMTLSMVLQQKLTPAATVDKTQKMMMSLMPVIFGFFMISLPSGLVLYMFVSTLFGIGQQMLVYRMID
jgi:YidC/Oxa1 family membrane protein insertase